MMAEGHPRNISKEDKGEIITDSSGCNSDQTSKMKESDAYEVGGGKLSLHGVAYQRKLLMLFALRSIIKHKKFKLATEMKKADKVDDVILIYPKVRGDGNVFRFLQAKHRIGNAKDMRKISATDLLKDSKDDFSIPAYFRAYLNIVDNCELMGEGDEISDVIICTNTGLWIGSKYEDVVLTNDMFEVIDEEDFIFGKTLRRFKQEFSGRKKIVSILMNCFSKFPVNFAKSVSVGETYDHQQHLNPKEKQLDVELLYEIVFVEEVINLKTKTFREDFVIGVNLSGIAKHFHNSLFSEWKVLNDEDDFENWLKNKVVDVNSITEDHGLKVKSIAKKLSESVRKNLTKGLIKIYDEKSALYKNMDRLKLFDVLELTEKGLRFSKRFLHSDGLCVTADSIRKEFIENLRYFKIDCNTLEDIKFELDDKLIQSKKLSIGKFKPEHYVEQFLSKLVFALDQPNEEELGIIVKDELKSFLIGSDIETGYSKLYRWIDEWLSSPKGKYLTEDDFKSFINDLKEEVFFDLRDPVSNFTGRTKELNELHETIFQGESRAAIISQTATISGLGGIGKSELARMYAKVHRKEFNNIIWIDSETQDTMESSFRRLAYDRMNISRKNSNGEDKRIESIVEEVYQRLEGKRNLFVFDNAEQLRSVEKGSNGVHKYISSSSKGSWNYYVITSRNRKWGAMKVLDLDKFTDDEAMEFFRVSFGDLDEFDSEEFKKLADALGNFPLAMQQAVAYIKETSDQLRFFNKRFTVSDYLKLFHAKSKDLLQHEFPSYCDDNYTRTTYTTMKIAIESISSKEHGSLSVEILNVISYLFSESIESSLLLKLFHKENELRLSKALQVLHQYSMISLQDSIARVHRLLQLVVRITLEEQGLEKEVLTNILDSLDPGQLEHSMSVWKYVSEYEDLVEKYAIFPELVLRALVLEHLDGPAVSFGEKLESTFRDVFGHFHFRTTAVRQLLGTAVAMKDSIKGARIIQSVFEDLSKFHGELHPFTLHTQELLTKCCSKSREYFDSVTISKDLFEKSKLVFGECSEFAITAKAELAVSLYQSLNYEEALKLFEEIKEELSRTSSLRIDTVLWYAELMIPLIKIELNGDYRCNYELFAKKLDEMLRKTDISLLVCCSPILELLVCEIFGKCIIDTFNMYYKNFTERYGCEEHSIIDWRESYARALTCLELFDSALKELNEIYDIQKKLKNGKHKNTINTKFWIAYTLCNKGNHREALTLHKEILAVRKELSDPNDPKILRSKHAIALEHSHLGDYGLALKIMEEVYEREKPDHVQRNKTFLGALVEYAEILQTAGLFEKAVLKFSEIQKLHIECLGERKIPTLHVGLQYSLALYDYGDRKKSLEVLNRVRYLFSKLDVKEDTLTFLSFNDSMALCLRKFNMNQDEKDCLTKVLKAEEKLFGKNRRRTPLTMCRLAIVECDLGNIQKARELVRDVENQLSRHKNLQEIDLEIKISLAGALMKINDLKKSLKILREVQKIQDEQGCLDQNFINTMMRDLAYIMGEQGKFDESLNILRDINSKQSSTIGPDHRETLNTIRLTVTIMKLKGDIDGAIKLCKELECQQKKYLGEEDIDTLRTKFLFAKLIVLKGNILEAFNSMKHCERIFFEKFGEDDVESLAIKRYVGFMHCRYGILEEGKKCLLEVYKKQRDLSGEDDGETAATKKLLSKVFRK